MPKHPPFSLLVFGFYFAPTANTRKPKKRLSGLVWGCGGHFTRIFCPA